MSTSTVPGFLLVVTTISSGNVRSFGSQRSSLSDSHISTPQETLMTGRLLASELTHHDAIGRGQHTQIP